MRSLSIALAFIAVSGCVSIPPGVQLPAGQALLVSEATVDGLNHGATVAANSGLLHGAQATTVKAGLDSVNHCVSGAHTVYASGNLPETATELKACFAKAAEVQALIKGAHQ